MPAHINHSYVLVIVLISLLPTPLSSLPLRWIPRLSTKTLIVVLILYPYKWCKAIFKFILLIF